MAIFCKHTWEILREVTTKSQFEHALESIVKADTANIKVPGQMCDANRKFIQVINCKKCGKLKRYVTSI